MNHNNYSKTDPRTFARTRFFNNIAEITLSDYVVHDSKYSFDNRADKDGIALISLEDFGHCVGLPNLKSAIIKLYKKKEKIITSLQAYLPAPIEPFQTIDWDHPAEADASTKEVTSATYDFEGKATNNFCNENWFKKLVHEICQAKEYEGADKPIGKLRKKRYIPFAANSSEGEAAVYRACLGAVKDALNYASSHNAQPSIEIIIRRTLTNLIHNSHNPIIKEIRDGQTTRANGIEIYVPFIVLDKAKLETAVEYNAKTP